MRRGNWILLPALALCAGSVLATDIPVSALGGNGWFSDDTRADGTGTYPAGTNLVSNTLTDDPEATATGSAAHNGDIAAQIVFGTAPGTVPSGTYPGAVHLQIGPSGSGKSQISHRKNDLTGHCTGAAAFGPGMSLEYSWMGDGTLSVTPSVKFGVKTSEYGSTGVSSRTGENVWDKVLIYEPGNLNGGTSDGLWHTETVDFSTGKWWFFDRTVGAGTIGNPMTLANMAVSGMTFSGAKTLADVYALITAPGAIVTSVQFGVGSGNAGASVYVNELTTSFYRSGDTVTFGSPPPVHNLTQDLFHTTIQSAITAALPGDVIEVSAGVYNEGLAINKSLTLLGPNAVLSPNTDTRVGEAVIAPLGNTHAIQGLAAGISVIVKGFRFDQSGANTDYRFVNVNNQASNTWTFEHNIFADAPGCVNGNWYLTGTLGTLYFNLLDNLFTGSEVSNGISLWGTGVHIVDIRDNVFRDNQGWAMNLNNIHGTIADNLFTDLVDNGALWYEDQSGMIIASTNNDLLLSGNTFRNMASLGLSIYNGFDGELTGTGNQFLNCASAGVRVRAATPVADLTDVHFSGNVFSGNTYGIENTMGGPLDAQNNWWGHGSGPLDASDDTGSGGLYNPAGLGDAVTDGIDYDPWVTEIFTATQSASNTRISVDNAGCPASTTVTFGITASLPVPEYFGYTFRISYPAGLRPTAYANNYTPGGTQGLTIATGLNTTGPLVVDWVLYGQSAFSTQTGNLFTVTFDGHADDPAAAITVTLAEFRQHDGAGFTALAVAEPSPTVVVVDGTNPVLLSAAFPGDPCINANFTVTVSGSDNQGLERVQYRFDNTGIWTDAITGITGTGHGPAGFTTSGVTGLGQGAHTIHVRYVDDVCNAGNEQSWPFSLDTYAPVAPTNLVATPDHGVVHLSWTAGSNYTGYRLYGLVRDGYPYWNDGVPGGGNDGLPGVGDPISAPLPLATFLPTDPTHFDHSVTDRGVYDYQIEAFDCAPNAMAHGNIASATNYFLGDWASSIGLGTFDGAVCFHDVNYGMSAHYGETTTNGASDHIDVAPTSNNSALGLPGPDHVINFEDLIIMAINYRLSCSDSPLDASREQSLRKDLAVSQAGSLTLAADGTTASLTLDGSLLGYSARLRTSSTLVGADCAGGLVMHYPVEDGYVVDLVALHGLLDGNTGVTLRFAGEAAVELVSAEGRDETNGTVDLGLAGGAGSDLPVAFGLEQNYPNPFNPVTTLRFALPVDSAVELVVFNTLGQTVATVVSGDLSAGWHEVTFDGSALASGVYYLHMEAGAYRELKRMVLLK